MHLSVPRCSPSFASSTLVVEFCACDISASVGLCVEFCVCVHGKPLVCELTQQGGVAITFGCFGASRQKHWPSTPRLLRAVIELEFMFRHIDNALQVKAFNIRNDCGTGRSLQGVPLTQPSSTFCPSACGRTSTQPHPHQQRLCNRR